MITLSNISMQYDDKILYENASLTLKPGDKIGLVGSNGSGKTTLLNIISQKIKPDEGDVACAKGFRLGVLDQEFIPDADKTVLEQVNGYAVALENRMDNLKHQIAIQTDPIKQKLLLERYKKFEEEYIVCDGYNSEARCKEMLGGFGFTEQMFNRYCTQFSGGQRMRMAIVRLLLEPYSGILLDEPTNHLDLPSLLWFEQFLQSYSGMVVMISHDRVLLNKVAKKIVEVSNRKLTVYDGNYDQYIHQKQLRITKQQSAFNRLEKQRQKTERFIERFRSKNTKASQVQSRIKQLAKQNSIELICEEQTIGFKFPQPKRSGYEVMRLVGISKKYSDTPILENTSLTIKRGEKVAVTGKNGVGKSTLIKIMAGILPYDSGDRKEGINVQIGYFSQIHVEQLDVSNLIIDEMLKFRGERSTTDVRKILGKFFFTGDDVKKTIGSLSGGEKSRLLLARLILSPANFLIMDEPTNHLDMSTQSVLIEALKGFCGTVCFISHDRYLINSIATRLIDFTGDKLVDYPGTYDEYCQWNIHRNFQQGTDKPKSVNQRKEEKKREAEDRNRKYKFRKDLDDKITVIEARLESLMAEEMDIERQLADPSNYKQEIKIKELNKRYAKIKLDIESLTEKWDICATEREKWL